MSIFERLHQLKILLRVVVHRRNELGSGLRDGLDLRRDDVAEILQPHVALALHAEAADAVARHLRQERAGHALDAERKAGVLDRAGVADVVQRCKTASVFRVVRPSSSVSMCASE